MKIIFENWRKYLNEFAIAPYSQLNRNIKPQKDEEEDEEESILKEAAKDVEDLPKNWFIKIMKPEEGVIRAELVQIDEKDQFQRIPGRKDPFSVIQAVHSDHPVYGDAYSDLNTYIIQKSSAPPGYGPLLYDIILEMAGDAGVTPDQSGIVSHYAKNVWEYYDKSRSDVTSEPFGVDEGNILKKIYKKQSQDKINKLKNSIPPKLIEDDTPTEEPKFIEQEATPFDPSNPEEWDFLEDLDENKAQNDSNKVSKVIIFNKNKEILLLKRVDGQKNWDLPGGHLKKGENHEKGAKRETKEETSLDISSLKPVKADKNIKFYKTTVQNADISLDPDEHTEYKWVKMDNLGDFNMRNEIKSAINAAFEPIEEDFQADVKKRHTKMKIRLIGRGGNPKKEGPGITKPSFKRSKSAPGGFGGA